VRSVAFHAARLDVAGDLDIHVEQLGASDAGVLYSFEVSAGGHAMVEGRVTVAFRK